MFWVFQPHRSAAETGAWERT